ncbi:PREDICTED: uncharacterized protein LOC109131693, partial [Camelina sativa]|uniref:Uncharacterized protein LOC109131693 n=1 Tax=Camelina sativa TaxID=90675 RepID=A0ABM1RHC3_CAMSA
MARLKRILYAYQMPIVPHPSRPVFLSLPATHTFISSEIVASHMLKQVYLSFLNFVP